MPIRKYWVVYGWVFNIVYTTGIAAAQLQWGLSMLLATVLWVFCGLAVAFGIVLATPFGTTVVLWLQEVSPIKVRSDVVAMLREVSSTVKRIRYRESELLTKFIRDGYVTGDVAISSRNNEFEFFKQRHLRTANYNLTILLGRISDSGLNRCLADEGHRRSLIQAYTIAKGHVLLTPDGETKMEILVIKLEKGHRELMQKTDRRIEELIYTHERSN